MEGEAQKTLSDRGWPDASAWRARVETPSLPREQPYLDTLPALITGTLLVLAASGLVLAVYYDPWHPYASIQFIRREVNSGWLIQSFHATGTTMLFGALYLLLFRGIMLRTYRARGEFIWLGTVALFCVLLLAGWLGYCLSGGAVAGVSLTQATASVETWNGLPGLLAGWFFGGPHGPGTLARLAMFHAVLGLAVFALVALLHAARKAARPVTRPSGRLPSLLHRAIFRRLHDLRADFRPLHLFCPAFRREPSEHAAGRADDHTGQPDTALVPRPVKRGARAAARRCRRRHHRARHAGPALRPPLAGPFLRPPRASRPCCTKSWWWSWRWT